MVGISRKTDDDDVDDDDDDVDEWYRVVLLILRFCFSLLLISFYLIPAGRKRFHALVRPGPKRVL